MIFERQSDRKDSTSGLTLHNLKDFLSSRDSVSVDIANRAHEVSKLQNELLSIRRTMYDLRRYELDRINKEFISNDYSRRFNNVNIKTVIYALVGKEFSENEINKQLKEHKVK